MLFSQLSAKPRLQCKKPGATIPAVSHFATVTSPAAYTEPVNIS